MQLPGSCAAAVAASGVRTNQNASRRPVAALSVQSPPTPNAFHRELCCVMSDSDIDDRAVLVNVVRAIGNRLSLGLRRKIMDLDFIGLPFWSPRLAPIFEGSDELLFLRVHGYHRIVRLAERLHLSVDVLKLRITVSVLPTLSLLGVQLQTVAHLAQTSSDCLIGNVVSPTLQFLRHRLRRLIRPSQRTHRVSCRRFLQDLSQCLQDTLVCFFYLLSSRPRLSNLSAFGLQ